jgi:hypothetical protein
MAPMSGCLWFRLRAASEDVENGGSEAFRESMFSSSDHSLSFRFRLKAGLQTWATGNQRISGRPIILAYAQA